MRIKYTKMHGIGNSYAFVNCIRQNLNGIKLNNLARKISDKKTGADTDGMILILPSKKADFRMRIFNKDGSEAEMCGNGIRCFAKYIYDRKISGKNELSIDTGAGIKKTRIAGTKNGKAVSVEVDMGTAAVINKSLEVDGKKYYAKIVSTGNPHCVIYVDNYDFDYRRMGKKIENNPKFPNRINVEFVKVNNEKDITMRVWERGSGETKACGTGACASVAAAVSDNKVGKEVTVHLLGGDLKVKLGNDRHLYMTGPAEEMESGEIEV